MADTPVGHCDGSDGGAYALRCVWWLHCGSVPSVRGIRIALCVVAALRLCAFRPWKIFSDERFPDFIATVKLAIIKLLS